MNTELLRQCATLLARNELRSNEMLIELAHDAADEIDLLKAEQRLIARTERGEVWFWQGDGFDFPESIGCPVVIDEHLLRRLISSANAKAIPAEQKDQSEDSSINPFTQNDSVNYRSIHAKADRENGRYAASRAYNEVTVLYKDCEFNLDLAKAVRLATDLKRAIEKAALEDAVYLNLC